MRSRAFGALHPALGLAVAGLTVTAVVFLVVAPPLLAFGVPVIGAVAWCEWLDRNAEEQRPRKGR